MAKCYRVKTSDLTSKAKANQQVSAGGCLRHNAYSSGSFCKHAASTLLSHLVYTLTQMIYFNTKFIYPIGVFHIWCTEEKYQPYNEWAHLPVVFPELSHFAADWSSPFANMFKSQKSLTISLAELFNYISSKWRDTISFLSHKVSQSLCVHLLAK